MAREEGGKAISALDVRGDTVSLLMEYSDSEGVAIACWLTDNFHTCERSFILPLPATRETGRLSPSSFSRSTKRERCSSSLEPHRSSGLQVSTERMTPVDNLHFLKSSLLGASKLSNGRISFTRKSGLKKLARRCGKTFQSCLHTGAMHHSRVNERRIPRAIPWWRFSTRFRWYP